MSAAIPTIKPETVHEGFPNLAAYIDGISAFIAAAPSSYHAVNTMAGLLERAGFLEEKERAAWSPAVASAGRFVRRDGALIAWIAGDEVGPDAPVRVFGAHSDSPTFKLKPGPGRTAEGWAQAGVEVYGGPLLNSWLDRDLCLAGRLVTQDGTEYLAQTGAVARIPQLAIHLDRGVNSGLELDKQKHTQPVLGLGNIDPVGLLATAAGIDRGEIAGWDVFLADTQPPARIGAADELLASGRLDNLSSVYAGLVALSVAVPAPGTIAMLAVFDHEELGSESRSGASGPFLEEVLARLQFGLGARPDDAARARAASWCLSADAGHAVHPNYPERHDPVVRPQAGAGPILKINANQRYASDAHGAALWSRVCAAAGVPVQEFVSSNQMPCGTTIGPLTATRIGIRTVDVGVPLLSMHSARELAHVEDLHSLARAATAFFEGA
jgi:aspartyl aminopeptidase